MEYKHTQSNLEKENEYPKLVRDRIPEIVAGLVGHPIKTRVMKAKEYDKYLRMKVVEEAQELAEAKGKTHIAEELADVMELIDTVIKENGLTLKDVRSVQKAKAKERGGFKKKILMLENAR